MEEVCVLVVDDNRINRTVAQAVLEAAGAQVVTAEDGIREGGVGSAIEDALARLAAEQGVPTPRVVVLGTPIAFIPQGKPDAILSSLGLDGPGVAASIRGALGR